ncbi:uncharacterized protein LOC128870368, partial [Anastrepha ludens]|uniref:uncharacterized protein LOC128870368 n=1 Tax=Anastrepha ludens TaxID=28586 RepID=UPI0023B02425
GRKKCTSIVKNVLAKEEKDNLVKKLKVNKFSIMVDESTDSMCSDGASVMIGQHNSFALRLIRDIPNAIVVKCICHSAAIIASKACLTLPRGPEDLLRQIGEEAAF